MTKKIKDKKKKTTIGIIIVLVVSFALAGLYFYVFNQTVLGEHSNEIGDGYMDIDETYSMVAQVFKVGCIGPESDFEVSKVNLLLYYTNQPLNIVTVEIRTVTTTYMPTEIVLATVTWPVELESTDSGWRMFTFDQSVVLEHDTHYAILVYSDNNIRWSANGDSVYCYGDSFVRRYESGTWTGVGANWDCLFELWGYT